MTRRIALIGAKGQLGTALQTVLAGEVLPLGHADIEISDAADVDAKLSQIVPGVVINAAAYNLVDKAEEEPQTAFAVNALGPRNLARFCGERDIPLVHVSTDYVFSGRDVACGMNTVRNVPYQETARPEPLSAYGVSKLAGEFFVRQQCPRHFVVRTCGLYGKVPKPGYGNFVETMLRLASDRDELRIVDDQRCGPTSVADLAGWIAQLVETTEYGLYHATNSGDATWCEFAREIFQMANVDVKVTPITSAEFGAAAERSPYSVLDCGKLERVLKTTFRPWRDALAEYIEQRVP